MDVHPLPGVNLASLSVVKVTSLRWLKLLWPLKLWLQIGLPLLDSKYNLLPFGVLRLNYVLVWAEKPPQASFISW